MDRTVQLTTANLRQVSPKNLKTFQQADLIVLEDTSEKDDPRTTEYLLSSLKTTGLPIILLPPINHSSSNGESEPLVLNLTEFSIAKPGLAALINKIKEHYAISVHNRQEPVQSTPWTSPKLLLESEPLADNRPSMPLQSSDLELNNATSLTTLPAQSSTSPDISSKVTYALTAMGRISKQLRGPLSNMNLAIHMLGQVQSLEERDRYVKLLREEYHRELQLLNELENLHNSLERIL
ncbi:MAG: hypothetical protein AAGF98_09585 [Cyanobacteria bacterium P01_H01_bin.153]